MIWTKPPGVGRRGVDRPIGVVRGQRGHVHPARPVAVLGSGVQAVGRAHAEIAVRHRDVLAWIGVPEEADPDLEVVEVARSRCAAPERGDVLVVDHEPVVRAVREDVDAGPGEARRRGLRQVDVRPPGRDHVVRSRHVRHRLRHELHVRRDSPAHDDVAVRRDPDPGVLLLFSPTRFPSGSRTIA